MKVCCCCKLDKEPYIGKLLCPECSKNTRFILCQSCYDRLLVAGMDLIAFCSKECSKRAGRPVHMHGLLALYPMLFASTYDLMDAMDVLYAL